jgi:hypothetical protein
MSHPLPKFATAATFERPTVDMAADRPILERSDLVLACAHVLHTNGQSTHETVEAAEWLGAQLGLQATLIAHWDELELRAADALKAGAAVATASLVACLLVGAILAPVARRWRAIRRHWLCLGSIDDARCLLVQNGKRTRATHELLECKLRGSCGQPSPTP